MKHIHYYCFTAMCIIMGAAGTMHSAGENNSESPIIMEVMHESALPSEEEQENVYTQPSSLREPESSFMLEEEVTSPTYEVEEPEAESVYNQDQNQGEEVELSLFEEQ